MARVSHWPSKTPYFCGTVTGMGFTLSSRIARSQGPCTLFYEMQHNYNLIVLGG